MHLCKEDLNVASSSPNDSPRGEWRTFALVAFSVPVSVSRAASLSQRTDAGCDLGTSLWPPPSMFGRDIITSSTVWGEVKRDQFDTGQESGHLSTAHRHTKPVLPSHPCPFSFSPPVAGDSGAVPS
jgi:hypothetical protein